MPVRFDASGLKRIQRGLRRSGEDTEARLSEIASNVATRMFEKLHEFQPIGQLDPYVDHFPGSREPRPSVRQHHTPIELGWIDPVIETPEPGKRVVTISTRSEHLQYFTMWTGRDRLGTESGVQIAKNKKTLAFWWKGEGHWPVSAEGGAFTPQVDFVQKAWEETKPYLDEQVDGFATYVMRNAIGDLVE